MPDHPEAAGDIVEHLGDVFAERGHVAAAGRTGAGAIVVRFVHDLLTRQMIRQLACALAGPFVYRQRSVFGSSLADLFGLAGFQLLEPQLKLFDLPGQPLRGAAELHPPQLGDLELQLPSGRRRVQPAERLSPQRSTNSGSPTFNINSMKTIVSLEIKLRARGGRPRVPLWRAVFLVDDAGVGGDQAYGTKPHIIKLSHEAST